LSLLTFQPSGQDATHDPLKERVGGVHFKHNVLFVISQRSQPLLQVKQVSEVESGPVPGGQSA